MNPKRRGPDPEIVARVQRAQSGDEQAFAELFQQLQSPVLNYAYQVLGDRSSAEDVTQDAFVVAHQRLGMLGPPYDFKSWVYRIAGNLAIDQIRRDRRLVDLEDADVRGEPPTTRRPPEKQVRRGEQRRMIRRTLERLPATYRQALVLREIHELTYEELARALDCSYDSARQLVHRARLRFRQMHGLRLLVSSGEAHCAKLDELLSAYQDAELTGEAEREVREHLAHCPHCREKQEDLRAVGALLAVFPPLLPSPQWTQYVLQQLHKQGLPGQGAGKVNARIVEQSHPGQAEGTGGEPSGASGEGGAGEPSPDGGRGGGADGGRWLDGLLRSGSGRWAAVSLFGAAAALGAFGLLYLLWRAPQHAAPTPLPATPPAATSAAGDTPTIGATSTAVLLPPAATPTATPTGTATPTEGPPMGTALQNANCRLGPGTAYRNIATLLEGQTTALEGRNAESTWWWIGTPGGSSHCWVWGGSLTFVGDLAGLPLIAAPPTDTPTPADTQAPTVSLVSSPSGPGRPTDHDTITLSARASDAGDVARIEIWLRAPNQPQALLIRTCLNDTSCTYTGGPYPAGKAEAFARAWDAADNMGQSSTLHIGVLVYLQ